MSKLIFYNRYLKNEIYKNIKLNVFFLAPCTSTIIRYESVAIYVTEILDELKIFSYDVVLIPINDNHDVSRIGGSHWSLLVYYKENDCFYYLDSLHNYNYEDALDLKAKLEICLRNVVIPIKCINCAQQTNSYDCGVYVLKFIDLILKGISNGKNIENIDFINFTPQSVDTLRKEIYSNMIKLVENK